MARALARTQRLRTAQLWLAASLTRRPIGSWAGRSGSGGPATINKGCKPIKAGRGEDPGAAGVPRGAGDGFRIRPMPAPRFPSWQRLADDLQGGSAVG